MVISQPGMSSLVWFRQDLRVRDNPALSEAARAGGPVVPVYIRAEPEEGSWPMGEASRWWLHHSLAALTRSLETMGTSLLLAQGSDSGRVLTALARATGATRVYWNRCYDPGGHARDQEVERSLRKQGVETHTYSSSLLLEPWDVATQSGQPFQVFTPFWRRCLAALDPASPLPAPPSLKPWRGCPLPTESLTDLKLLPKLPWADPFAELWSPGEEGAHRSLHRFLDQALENYLERRNFPAEPGTSRLSSHLHFGEISPRQIWHAVRQAAHKTRPDGKPWSQSQFITELGWREFAHHLLFHFPTTPSTPLRTEFLHFPWRTSEEDLRAWQRGGTGYPIVDAGMRELWATGWMHNRVRMIVGSFLVKDLGLSWTHGARWFWSTLLDADLANNTLGWQWVAGCGADAAPYFRVFNPVLQGEKFDPTRAYVRRWVPEIANLPDEWIYKPWMASSSVLTGAGIRLGKTYPEPMVDHAAARTRALHSYKRCRP